MMPRDEVVALYHRLEAPPFEEMDGEFAASLLDQGSARSYLLSAFMVHMKDAFHLEYADLNDFKRGGPGGAVLHTMFDEVRKVAPGLYLGIGRAGFTERGRSDLHPFILEGPVAPFVTQG
jgi:hypothetical protein